MDLEQMQREQQNSMATCCMAFYQFRNQNWETDAQVTVEVDKSLVSAMWLDGHDTSIFKDVEIDGPFGIMEARDLLIERLNNHWVEPR